MTAKFEIFKDARGKYRFHLKSPNGEIIASSEGYTTRGAAMKGILSVQTYAPAAPVVDKNE